MDTPRVSDIVVEKIERSILEGTLKPGQRLPAERKFAEQMGVSRPSLREALQKLSARGMLVARRGGAPHNATSASRWDGTGVGGLGDWAVGS
jgi:GntR family transcriptional repressor for pyruvate dehydrogenase complex